MPAQTEHHVGGTKLFECRVGGFPRPQIRWYKDGREITSSSRYQFEHTNDGVISMVIRNITHEDEGHYRCRAENSEGLASTSAYLLVRAHKEAPDEPSTSVHSMQFEEAVAHSDNYKRIKEIRQKIADLDNDNSYHDGYLSKPNRKHKDEDEEEELTWKTLETVISAQKSSSHLITASSNSSSQKDIVEEESSKISKDMLEKAYHSSDDDLDSVRLKTISERSEPISLQGSLKDSGDEQDKSLLMRQTARLFSQEFDEDEDFFKIDSHYQAVMSVMAKEGAVEQPLPGDQRAAQADDIQVKSNAEKLQVLKQTEMKAVTSKSITSVDSDSKTTVSKELSTQVVTEEKVLQILKGAMQVDGTKLLQNEDRTVLKESRQVESVCSTKAESISTPTKSDLLKTSETSSVQEASSFAENLVNVEKLESLLGDVNKEGDESPSVKESTKHALSTREQLSADEVDSKKALADILSCSKDDGHKMSTEKALQVLIGEKEMKSEEEEELEESDSETEGSVHSVIGVDITALSAEKNNQESNVDTGNIVSGPGLKDNGEDDTHPTSREDHPIIHPEDIDDGSGVDGRTDEIVEQRTSWVEKVADDKAQLDKEDDATAIGGDKEVTPTATKPVLKQKMEDIKVEAGKTLRLRTQVQATPRAEVMWSKEGEVIIAGERITIVTEDDVYTLVIENVGAADAGRYRMTAINSAGSIYSEVLVSIVGLPPEEPSLDLSPPLPIGHPQFVMRPQDVTFAEFESIKLSCSIKGDPVPKVTWEKDGEKLRTSKHIRLYESRGVFYLEIPEAEAEDAGQYVCIAVNSEGTVTATVSVTMQGSENIVQISEEADTGAELMEGATGGVVESSSDVRTSDSRGVRYLKLFGMAAAFSLAAIGVKKLMENFPK